MSEHSCISFPLLRPLSSALLYFLLLLAGSIGTQAQAISLSLSPASQSVSVGGSASVDIVISDLAPVSVGAYDIDLSFNPVILSFGNAVFGVQLDLSGSGSSQSVSLVGGTVNLSEVSFDPVALLDSNQLDSFTLATVLFTPLVPGSNPLTLTINALGDSAGAALAADISNGVIAVNQTSSAPAPNTTLLVLAGMLLLAAAHIRRR